MRYVEVAGVRVSAIGLGAWQFGAGEWGYGDDYARREAPAIVGRALDLGINLIDTAEAYGRGRSERIVGAALRTRRGEAFLATKLLPLFPLPSIVKRRARASAARLGVVSVDLYQIHWPNPIVPLAWQMEGMRRVQDGGRADHVGVSNFSLDRWRAAERALGRPVLSNQVRFNLVDRGPLRDLVPYAQREDRLVIAYSPLAQGLLAGRYDAMHRPAGSVRLHNVLFAPENLARSTGLMSALRDVAHTHGATPAQIALAWVIRRPHVVAIPGASSVEQVEANAAAADIELADEEDLTLVRAADEYRPDRGMRIRAETLTRRSR